MIFYAQDDWKCMWIDYTHISRSKFECEPSNMSKIKTQTHTHTSPANAGLANTLILSSIAYSLVSAVHAYQVSYMFIRYIGLHYAIISLNTSSTLGCKATWKHSSSHTASLTCSWAIRLLATSWKHFCTIFCARFDSSKAPWWNHLKANAAIEPAFFIYASRGLLRWACW